MRIALAVLVLLGLACSSHCIPLPNIGGHVSKIRDTLEHINQVRSALRRSIDRREADKHSKARSAVKELEHLSNEKRDHLGFLGNTLNAIRKSAELARRHAEIEKRNSHNDDNRVFRDLADKIKQAAEQSKHKRDMEETTRLAKRFCGIGLGFCAPEFFEHAKRKRDEDSAVLRNAAEKISRAAEREEDSRVYRNVVDSLKQAVEEAKHKREMEKRSRGGFIGHALNAIQRSAEMANRHFERNNEEQRALRSVADSIKKAVENANHKREEEQQVKRDTFLGLFGHPFGFVKKSAEMAKRHAGLEVADKMKKAATGKRDCTLQGYCPDDISKRDSGLESIREIFGLGAMRRSMKENERAVGEAANAVKKAVEAAKMKREEGPRLFVRQPMAASKSAITGNFHKKKSSTSDEQWKRKVREVLDSKAAQVRATEKRFPFRALPGQAFKPMTKRSKYMGSLGVKYNANYHPSGSL